MLRVRRMSILVRGSSERRRARWNGWRGGAELRRGCSELRRGRAQLRRGRADVLRVPAELLRVGSDVGGGRSLSRRRRPLPPRRLHHRRQGTPRPSDMPTLHRRMRSWSRRPTSCRRTRRSAPSDRTHTVQRRRRTRRPERWIPLPDIGRRWCTQAAPRQSRRRTRQNRESPSIETSSFVIPCERHCHSPCAHERPTYGANAAHAGGTTFVVQTLQ